MSILTVQFSQKLQNYTEIYDIPETKWTTLGYGKLTSKAKHPQFLFLFERLGKAFKTAHPGKKFLSESNRSN